MINRPVLEELGKILSNREIDVIVKRLANKSISRVESNYLSRSIRPKLRAAEIASSLKLLSLLDYRRKKYEREKKILKKKIISSVKKHISIKNLKAIVLYGSYIRNKHSNYRDIDVMILLKNKIWKSSAEKSKIQNNIVAECSLKLDVQLIVYRELAEGFPYSPILQTELEEYQVIYGKLYLDKARIIDKEYLLSRLLEVEYVLELWKKINSKYIYGALRSCLAIELFLEGKISNELIIRKIRENIGEITADSLIESRADILQKEIGFRYLKYWYSKLKEKLG